jgi:hypothetical protein
MSKVTIDREKLMLVLGALEDMHIVDFPLEDLRNWNKVITVIKEALALPSQEQRQPLTPERIKELFQKYGTGRLEGFTAALQEALAKPAQGPNRPNQVEGMEWLSGRTRSLSVKSGVNLVVTWDFDGKNCDVVISAPQRTWVGLTDEQKMMCWSRATCHADVEHKTEHQCLIDYASEIEAKLKEKNT